MLEIYIYIMYNIGKNCLHRAFKTFLSIFTGVKMKNRVISDVISHSGLGGHPRIILTESDFDRIRTVDDPIYVAGRAYVISVADSLLDKPLLVYEIPDGIRLLQVSRDTLHASLHLGMAYRLTKEKKYAIINNYRSNYCSDCYKRKEV